MAWVQLNWQSVSVSVGSLYLKKSLLAVHKPVVCPNHFTVSVQVSLLSVSESVCSLGLSQMVASVLVSK
jgi:hypothetical protein